MSLFTTNAIILRSMAYKDSSFIVTLLLESGLRFNAIAHGARKLANTNNASYQQGNLVRVVLYKKTELNTMGTISQISILEQYPKMKMNYNKLAFMQYFLEFVYKNTEDGETNVEFYDLLSKSFTYLNEETPIENWRSVWDYHALKALGIQPSITSCIHCDKKINEGNWIADEGGIACSHHGQRGIPITEETTKLLLQISKGLVPTEKYHIPMNVVKILDLMINAFAYGPYLSLSFFSGKTSV